MTAAGAFRIQTNSNSNSFIVNGLGNVGIGTSPSYPLQVRRAGGAGSLGISIDSVGNTDRTVQYFSIQDSAAGVGAGHAFYYRAPSSTTDVAGMILDEGGNVGIGTTSPAAKLVVSNAGAYGIEIDVANEIMQAYTRTTSEYAELKLYTNTLRFFNGTSATITECMRITAAGNVGIGTASPSQKLQVAGNVMVSPNSNYIFDNLDNADEGALIWRNADASRTTTAQIISISDGTFARKALGFFTKSTADWTTAATERMRITADGNVGIGTASPSAALDVRVNSGILVGANSRSFIRQTAGGDAEMGCASGGYLSIYSDGSEKMRIISTGEILIGYTADQGAYLLQVNGAVYASSYFESSDIRLKNVVSSYESETFGAIEYNWKDGRDAKLHWGYSAQAVQKYLPDAVNENKDGFLTLDYTQAHTYKIMMLEKEVKELKEQLKQK
jgi:hypothetical protein